MMAGFNNINWVDLRRSIEIGEDHSVIDNFVRDAFRVTRIHKTAENLGCFFQLIYELIVSFGFDINTRWSSEEGLFTPTMSKLTFLHMACILNKSDWVTFLLDHGADMTAEHTNGKTPLMQVYGMNDEIFLLLLNRGGGLLANKPHLSGIDALNFAIKKRDHDLVLSLLKDYGVQHMTTQMPGLYRGEFPFIVAANLKDVDIISLLLTYKYAPNDSQRRTALKIACGHSDFKMVSVLLCHGVREETCSAICKGQLLSTNLDIDINELMKFSAKLATARVLLQHDIEILSDQYAPAMAYLRNESSDDLLDINFTEFYVHVLHNVCDKNLSIEEISKRLKQERIHFILRNHSDEVIVGGIKVRFHDTDGPLLEKYFDPHATVDVVFAFLSAEMMFIPIVNTGKYCLHHLLKGIRFSPIDIIAYETKLEQLIGFSGNIVEFLIDDYDTLAEHYPDADLEQFEVEHNSEIPSLEVENRFPHKSAANIATTTAAAVEEQIYVEDKYIENGNDESEYSYSDSGEEYESD